MRQNMIGSEVKCSRPFGSHNFVAAVIAGVVVLSGASPQASAETALKASYTISISGLTIGKAEADSRFTDAGYAAVVKGMTTGISRLFSNARATMLGNGHFSGTRVMPASYNMETSERGFETHVRMSMHSGTVTDLLAMPQLREAPDRVQVGPDDTRNVVDPLGAFIILTDRPGLPDGGKVCDRTIRVFDGWQRFDIGLAYKQSRLVTGIGDAYDGRVVACTARYVPIAGHRQNQEATKYMAENKRLEVWYAPVREMPLLVPYRILIGTKYGDLIITSTRFVVGDAKTMDSMGN
jgi:Protein of unknown function (DUF3108)